MQLPVHIQFRGMDASDALEASVRAHAHRLENFAPDIMTCRVAIELEQKHQQQGRPYAVRIDLTLPGHELVVNRVQDEDVYVALRDAFDNMKRQLEDVVRQRRGQEKQHAQPLHGELVRLDGEGGFGFIRTPGGDEYYFGRDNVVGTPFENLQTGSAVQFIPDVGGEGLQARRVSLGKHGMAWAEHAPTVTRQKNQGEILMGERLTTGEICTRSVTIALRSTPLDGAARLMRENHVGCLVVVDEVGGQRIVVGVLTDRDIVTAVVAPGLDAATLQVADVMTTDLVTAREEDSLIDLMRTMRRKGVRRIPVVGGQGELVGVVTLDDVLDILSQEFSLLVGAIDSEGKRERQMRR